MSGQTEKEKLETLRQTVKFFGNLLASLIDGVVITDESHNIIVVNDAFCNLLGRHRREVIETNLFLWLDLLNAGIPPRWTEMTQHLYHEGYCRDVEFQVTTTHGMKYLSINASLLKNDITGKVCHAYIWRDITNLRQSEESLRESEQRFRTVTESANDAIICLDAAGAISLWNKKAEDMFGYLAGEAIGKDLHSLIVPEKYREKAYEGLKAFSQTGKGAVIGKVVELSALHRDGSEFPIGLSISAMNIRGKWQCAGIIRDITEHKRLEAEKEKLIHDLGERIKELKTLYSTTRTLQVEEKTVEEQIQAIANFLPAGWQYPDITVARIWFNGRKFVSPGFSESRWVQKVAVTIDEGKQLTIEVFYIQEMPDEAEGPFLAEERQLIYAIAELLRYHINRRQIKNTLRESEERYRLVTELTSDFIFKITVSPGGQMVLESVTQRLTDITGYSPDEIRSSDTWQNKICAGDRPVSKNFSKTLLSGQSGECKLRVITKSGEVKWIRIVGRPLRDGHKGRITSIVGAGKNITEYIRTDEERRQLQGELVEKERFLEAVLRQMPVGIIVAEAPGGRLYLYNKKVAELLRHPFYPASDIEQYAQYKGFHPDGKPYKPEEWPLARSVKAGKVVEGEEIDYLCGDGTHRWLEVYSGPICNEQGHRTGAIVSFFDVTARKHAMESVVKLNAFLMSNRKINEALVRIEDETVFFRVVCDSLIRVEFVKFTWIGLIEKGEQEIDLGYFAGYGTGNKAPVAVRWSDYGYGIGPTEKAIKTGKTDIVTDIESDIRCNPWLEEARVAGLVSYGAFPLKHGEDIIGILCVYSDRKNAFGEEEVDFLTEVADDICIGVKSLRLEKELQQSFEKIQKTLDGTIDTIVKICEKRDPYTVGHERRVARLACAIAGEMGFSKDQIEGIRVTSCLHDIGKMEVPAEILSKPTRLSEIEFLLIKAHSHSGYEILKDVGFPWPVARIILQHHERLDGSGYPNGLKGNEIMLEARILAVADTVEAMSTHRPYRPALGLNVALGEITQGKGILYDPAVVDVCLRLFRRKRFKFD